MDELIEELRARLGAKSYEKHRKQLDALAWEIMVEKIDREKRLEPTENINA